MAKKRRKSITQVLGEAQGQWNRWNREYGQMRRESKARARKAKRQYEKTKRQVIEAKGKVEGFIKRFR